MAKQKLKIDPQFATLIPPLSDEEYLQLEQSILDEGCREPLTVWNNLIVDGHNRFRICKAHGLVFRTRELHFASRDEVISWICSNQLGRRNLSEESRKYLIGKRYEAEKKIGVSNAVGKNQYTGGSSEIQGQTRHFSKAENGLRTSIRLGREYNISHSTVEKYGRYAQALDDIRHTDKELVPRILSGQVKISHANAVELSRKSPHDAAPLIRTLRQESNEPVRYMDSRKFFEGSTPSKTTSSSTTLKDMPAYDPDESVNSLSLTIPSWYSSIHRVFADNTWNQVSYQAKANLSAQLLKLSELIQEILTQIGGTSNG